MCYIDVSETDRLIFDSDSEGLLFSDDSDIEDADDLSEDADNGVPVDIGLKYIS
jgi:hypothetical protein